MPPVSRSNDRRSYPPLFPDFFVLQVAPENPLRGARKNCLYLYPLCVVARHQRLDHLRDEKMLVLFYRLYCRPFGQQELFGVQGVHAPGGWSAVRSSAGVSSPASACASTDGASGKPGAHIFSPSHRWPHQQMPSALIMQVPVPQQRVSSFLMGLRPFVEGIGNVRTRRPIGLGLIRPYLLATGVITCSPRLGWPSISARRSKVSNLPMTTCTH